jgi:2-polyprenyl-3-methyl-5-hydroxy-6-metoxy-1,4-benzoquinol methylase
MHKAKPTHYGVVVQAGPDEIMGAGHPDNLNLTALSKWPSVCGLVVALPAIEGAEDAAEQVRQWGFPVMIGDAYNVARRILDASDVFLDQTYVVRVLVTWKNMDLLLIDEMVRSMQDQPCDEVTVPRDFDVTMAADVASRAAIQRVSKLEGHTAEAHRARFNPFGYMETHPDQFVVRWYEPAPTYDQTQCGIILGAKRCHPENEYFGRDYAGSGYDFLLPWIPDGARVLDIACGSGYGSNILSKRASFCLGSDYLESYIKKARERFPETARLQFIQSDGQSFLWEGGEQFDVVVSLHTLEHVPDDRTMIRSLAANLKPGGLLILEVPLLALRPVGVPINPFHLREYSVPQVLDLVDSAGLHVLRKIGCCRGFTCSTEAARDAIQIHAVK